MTRSEHLTWTKERALEYLPDSPTNALASFLSDMSKHDELVNHAGLMLGQMLMVSGRLTTACDVKDPIDGYN